MNGRSFKPARIAVSRIVGTRLTLNYLEAKVANVDVDVDVRCWLGLLFGVDR